VEQILFTRVVEPCQRWSWVQISLELVLNVDGMVEIPKEQNSKRPAQCSIFASQIDEIQLKMSKIQKIARNPSKGQKVPEA
jgi:hypothetical protein